MTRNLSSLLILPLVLNACKESVHQAHQVSPKPISKSVENKTQWMDREGSGDFAWGYSIATESSNEILKFTISNKDKNSAAFGSSIPLGKGWFIYLYKINKIYVFNGYNTLCVSEKFDSVRGEIKYIDIKKFDNSMGVPDEVMTKIKNQISPPEAWTRSMNKFNSLKVLLLQSIYPLSWLS